MGKNSSREEREKVSRSRIGAGVVGETSQVVRAFSATGLGCMFLILPGMCCLEHVMHSSELQFLHLQMRELG